MTNRFKTSRCGKNHPRRGGGRGVERLEVRRLLDAAPIAIDDHFGVFAGDALEVAGPGLLANDLDADGDALSASLGMRPEHGMLDLSPDGALRYTPEAGFLGVDQFTYLASDGSLFSAPASVVIHVVAREGGTPPQTQNDHYAVSHSDILVVPVADGVLANDTAEGEEPLTATLVAPPASGTVKLNPTGSFQYIPSPGFQGEVEFQYQASDGVNPPSTAKVTIDVSPTEIEYRQWKAEEGGNGHVYAIVEESALWDTAVSLAAQRTFQGSSGYLATFAGAEEYEWFVANFPARISSIGGFQDTSSPDYSEPGGGWSWITGEPWDFTAWGVEEPNDLGGEDFLQWSAGGWNDIGEDHGNPAYVVEFDAPRPPTLTAVDDEYAVSRAGETVVLVADGVLTNDVDPFGEALSAALVSGPSHGALDFHADGSFTYQPDGDFEGTDVFTYEVLSAYGDTAEADVRLIVGGDNQAPVAAADAYAAVEDEKLTVPVENGVLANDVDADEDPLQAVLVSGASHGELTLHPDGSFEYQPDEDFFGTDGFTYRAADGRPINGESQVVDVTINVASVNDVPVAVNDYYEIAVRESLDETEPQLTLKHVALPANDLLYDAGRDVVYASLRATVALGNSVVALDPRTGEVLRDVFVGSNPNRLAMSDDGDVLYVGIDGANAVRRVDLDTFTAGMQFSLGAATAADLAVLPGASQSVAVARKDGGNDRGTAIYDVGIARPATVGIGDHIEIAADGSALFGYRPRNSARSLFRAEISPQGLVNLLERSYYVRAVDGLTWDDGWLFLGSGETVRDTDLQLVGTYPVTDQRHVLPVGDRVFQLDDGTVNVFERDRFVLLDQVTLPGVASGEDFISLGDGAFALHQGNEIVLVQGDELRADPRLGVLRNDVDPEGDRLTAELVAGPAHGRLIFHDDGSFLYQPTSTFRGVDQFQYRAIDASGATSEVAVVEIQVGGEVVVPIARDDAFSVEAGGAIDTTGQPSFEFNELAVKANDIVYDAARDLLYATLPGNHPGGNSLVAIDPATGELGEPLFVGSEPDQLALADDGKTLYVGVNGSRSVARIDLDAFAVVDSFSLGDDPAEDMAVRPGRPNTLAVAYLSPGGFADGVTLFVDGVKQARQGQLTDTVVFSGDGETLYAQFNVAVPRTLTAYSIEEDGLHKGVEFEEEVRAVLNIAWADDRIYRYDGLVFDAASLNPVGDFSVEGSVLPLLDLNRVLFLQKQSLFVGDASNYVNVAEAPIPANVDDGRSLVRTGPHTFAYLDGDHDVVLMVAQNLAGENRASVLDNDSLPAGNDWTVALVSDVSHGTLTLHDDGALEYQPTPGFVGVDYFTYRIVGSAEESEPVAVVLGVGGSTPLAGDVNLDGVVDLRDFTLMKANFGAGDSLLEGDANGDGIVDLVDFNLLKTNFGLSGGVELAASDHAFAAFFDSSTAE